MIWNAISRSLPEEGQDVWYLANAHAFDWNENGEMIDVEKPYAAKGKFVFPYFKGERDVLGCSVPTKRLASEVGSWAPSDAGECEECGKAIPFSGDYRTGARYPSEIFCSDRCLDLADTRESSRPYPFL